MDLAPLEITGSPGSPYTRKLIAALRYRRIAHRVHWSNGNMPSQYPKPKVPLLPTVFLRGDAGMEALVDTTPIIRRLEQEHRARSLIPNDPALRLINSLIEDYADEFVTKMMFHYRWMDEDNADQVAALLTHWLNPSLESAAAAAQARHFKVRQTERLWVVGSNDQTGPLIEAAFERLVKLLSKTIADDGFLLGSRPSSADFALYGQLSQLMVIDQKPARLGSRLSPRLRAWVDLMEDLSGLPVETEDWTDRISTQARLHALLEEIGKTYVPVMIANAQAVERRDADFETEVFGCDWQQPVFPYQAKCVTGLIGEYKALDLETRAAFDDVISGTRCGQLFQLAV